MSKKIHRPRLLLAAIIFMIVSAVILAQTIRSFTADNRSQAYSNLSASKCVPEGGAVPIVKNPPKCCDGLVLGTDPSKVGQRGYGGTCMKPTADGCIPEGGAVPAIQNPPKCCDGLVLGTDPKKTGLRGYVGTCMKPTPDGCISEGGAVPAIQNPPKCCEGLYLKKSTRLKGATGTCVPRLKCNQTCRTNNECQAGLICYKFQSVIDGVVNPERSWQKCRNPLNRSDRTCSGPTTTTLKKL